MDEEFQKVDSKNNEFRRKADVIYRYCPSEQSSSDKKEAIAWYMANQITNGKTSEQVFEESVKAKSYWRSKVVSMINEEPHLSYVENLGPDGEIGVSFSMTTQGKHQEPLGIEDLRIVHRAM